MVAAVSQRNDEGTDKGSSRSLLTRLRSVQISSPRVWTTLTWVIVAGALVRLVLMPLWFGMDFKVWEIVSRELLRGNDFYANKPKDMPGGPYAYLPLFAYLEVPFRALSELTGTAFLLWGKIPVVAGDAMVAWAIVKWARRAGLAESRVAFGLALFWLNPLVLFNGPLYGRFDSFVVGLMMIGLLHGPPTIATKWYRSKSTIWFAASVAAKTFPAFVLPWFWRNSKQRVRFVGGIIAMTALWSLPFSLLNPSAFIHSTVLYDTKKVPTNLSWQVILVQLFPQDTTRAIGTFILIGFFASLIALTKLDLLEYCAAAFCAFVVFSKIVNEQYLVWAIPFLVLLVAQRRGKHHAYILALFTAVGTFVNPLFHPLGLQGRPNTFWVNFLMAGATAVYLVVELRTHASRQLASEFDLIAQEYFDEQEREQLNAAAPADVIP